MIASAHLSSGAVVGLLVQKYMPANSGVAERIAAGFCAGIISHIVLDAVPHEEYTVKGLKLGIVLSAEILVIFSYIFYQPRPASLNWIILSGIAGAAFPDLFALTHRYIFHWEWLRQSGRMLHVFHANSDAPYPLSLLLQCLLTLLLLFFT